MWIVMGSPAWRAGCQGEMAAPPRASAEAQKNATKIRASGIPAILMRSLTQHCRLVPWTRKM